MKNDKSWQQQMLKLQFEFCPIAKNCKEPARHRFSECYFYLNNELVNLVPPDSPPTRMTQASAIFFGSQDLSRECNFIKPLASTPGKTLPIGEILLITCL